MTAQAARPPSSVFLQCPPRETRGAIVAATREAGEVATRDAPLAWVRLEPEALTDGVRDSVRMVVDLTTWPGANAASSPTPTATSAPCTPCET